MTTEAPARESGTRRRAPAYLRYLPVLGTLIGLGLAVWLVASNDLNAVSTAFGRIGLLGLLLIVCVRAIIVLLCGWGWQRLLAGLTRAEAAAFLILRFVREGINVLLPVASVGGEIAAGRLLTFWGVAGALSAASLAADMLIQAGTQAGFTLVGVALLRQLDSETARTFAGWALNVVGLAIVALTAFFAVQRRMPARFGGSRFAVALRRLRGSLDVVWAPARIPRLAEGILLHALAWGLGALEIWLALTFMGIEVGPAEALILESLTQAVRSAAFPVPSGLGVQEGGFVVLGALFGLDAGTAIALSLAKRVPDVALGLPSLIVWQMLEARGATITQPGG